MVGTGFENNGLSLQPFYQFSILTHHSIKKQVKFNNKKQFLIILTKPREKIADFR